MFKIFTVFMSLSVKNDGVHALSAVVFICHVALLILCYNIKRLEAF